MAYEGPHPLPVKSGGTGAITLTGVLTGNGTSAFTANTVTQHGVLVGGASNAVGSTGVGSTGQVLQGVSGSDPTYSTATFPSTATSTGTILRADGTNWVATTSTYPNTNAVSTLLYASASNVMSALTTANDGLLVTSNTGVPSILAGPGTTGQVLQANAAAAPSFSTASYPSTTTINQLLYSSSANTVAGLATANQGVLTTGATGIPVITALATNGQLIIGSTAGVPAAATLTQGAGITITNGSNTITIASTGASGGGLVWTDVTGATQTIVAGNGYLADRGGGVAFTLPASGTIGDVFRIVGVQGSWTLAQAAGQQIKYGSSATTVGATGSLASTNAGDCIECVATNTSASTVWRVMSSVGNITVA